MGERAPKSALVGLRAGDVVTKLDADPDGELARFVPTVGELYAQESCAWAYAAFESTVRDLDASSLHEVVLVGRTHACVAQRVPWAPDHALVTVASWDKNVGSVVAAARAALERIEDERTESER